MTTSITPTAIFAPPTREDIINEVLTVLVGMPGFPISDWHVGGVGRTIFELEFLALADLLQTALPSILGCGLLDFAVNVDTNWVRLVAKQLYNLDFTPAVVAVQNLTLTCAAGSGPYTITAGTLWAQGTTGNRWVSKTGGTLPTNSTLSIQISAEGPGSKYKDPSGTIRTLLTQLPGVTCANTAPDFTAIAPGSTNISTGTITPSRTSGGTPPNANNFVIRIDSAGQVGAGAWSYSTDGGVTFTSGGTIAASAVLTGGTTIAFANGAVHPSFAAGDSFFFSTPGSPIVTAGQDEELDAALIARCKARFPDIAALPTQSRYAKWAKAASAEVTRVKVFDDPTYPGRLYVTLAGLAGPVTGGAVTAVQAYIDPRGPIGRILVAQTSAAAIITAAGTVYVPRSQVAAVQAAAQIAWQNYLLTTDIGGTVRIAALLKVVMDAGAIDFQGIQLNGGGVNLTLSSTLVAVLPVATPLLSQQLTWVPV